MDNPTSLLFQPSGLNERFSAEPNLSFSDYTKQVRHMLTKARLDLTSTNIEKILAANSPQEWLPQQTSVTASKGALLIHGLYDSTLIVQDLGKYLSTQNMLVRSILLPGHGTVPGDLLNIQYTEWLRAVDYGVETLAKEVEQIFIVGLSLGGVLALHKALRDQRIAGIVLIAPALEIKYQWMLQAFIQFKKFTNRFINYTDWYIKRPFQKDYAKYESFCYNAPFQILQTILATNALLKTNPLSIPIFLTVSTEDEIISSQRCLSFFNSLQHPKSRLLWYSASSPKITQHDKIIYKNSRFPEEKIIDFSHYCLPISPDNPHYGRHGDYQDFLRYPNNQPPTTSKNIFLGAVNPGNLRKYTMQRLSYNPDFEGMMEMMLKFLGSI